MENNSKYLYSIIIAAKNEEATIGKVLEKLQYMTDDLIVVDGNSTDKTVEIASRYGAKVYNDNGLGKGDAIRVGLKHVKHDITVFIDADGSHDPGDIPKLVDPIIKNKADLVMGSRMRGGSDELYSSLSEVIRLIGSLVISLSINWKYKMRLTDYQNGFRAIRTEVARVLNLKSDITTIEQEMSMNCLCLGYRVMEVPTHEYRRAGGESKINVKRVALKYVGSLISGLLVKPRRAIKQQ
jgi:dolichol-phosphate mannosyltransferase